MKLKEYATKIKKQAYWQEYKATEGRKRRSVRENRRTHTRTDCRR